MSTTRVLYRRMPGKIQRTLGCTSLNGNHHVISVIPTASYRHHINRPDKPSKDPINPLYDDPSLNVVREREEFSDVWFQITGYDFVSVESYSQFVHKMVKSLELNCEVVVMPPRNWDISTFKPYSEDTEHMYQLSQAHRIVTVSDISSPILSLLTDMLHRHIPSGVKLSLSEADPDYLEFRYVPDGDIKVMEEAIEDLDNPKLRKRNKGGRRA